MWQDEVSAAQTSGVPASAQPTAPAERPMTRDIAVQSHTSSPSTAATASVVESDSPQFFGPVATGPLNALHPMLAAADQQQKEQEAYNDNFINFLGQLLGPAHSMEDLRTIASSYEQQMIMPTPLIESSSDAFTQKMMQLAFTDDALKLMVREHIIGNPEFPLFSKVQPGTKAETELLSKLESTIQQQLREAF